MSLYDAGQRMLLAKMDDRSVVIVGSGIVGLCAAEALLQGAEPGRLRVCVLEAHASASCGASAMAHHLHCGMAAPFADGDPNLACVEDYATACVDFLAWLASRGLHHVVAAWDYATLYIVDKDDGQHRTTLEALHARASFLESLSTLVPTLNNFYGMGSCETFAVCFNAEQFAALVTDPADDDGDAEQPLAQRMLRHKARAAAMAMAAAGSLSRVAGAVCCREAVFDPVGIMAALKTRLAAQYGPAFAIKCESTVSDVSLCAGGVGATASWDVTCDNGVCIRADAVLAATGAANAPFLAKHLPPALFPLKGCIRGMTHVQLLPAVVSCRLPEIYTFSGAADGKRLVFCPSVDGTTALLYAGLNRGSEALGTSVPHNAALAAGIAGIAATAAPTADLTCAAQIDALAGLIGDIVDKNVAAQVWRGGTVDSGSLASRRDGDPSAELSAAERTGFARSRLSLPLVASILAGSADTFLLALTNKAVHGPKTGASAAKRLAAALGLDARHL